MSRQEAKTQRQNCEEAVNNLSAMATAKLELLAEVNEVGSYDGAPRVGLLVAEAFFSAKKARAKSAGGLVQPQSLGDLNVTREQARWFGTLLYRRVRITIEDAGPLSEQEQLALNELEAEFDVDPESQR